MDPERKPYAPAVRISVCGAGYVGLASAAILAHIGHEVRVLDHDEQRIRVLAEGRDPLGEPGLGSALARPNIMFTSDPRAAYRGVDAILVSVGTPTDAYGRSDLSQLVAAAATIAETAAPCLVFVRSTAPVGTGDALQAAELRRHIVLVNPEFLREGHALADSLNPYRIVCGGPSAEQHARAVYGPLLDRQLTPLPEIALTPEPVPLHTMDRRSAELAKYATNAFLATKVSFADEVANIASLAQADVHAVLRVVAGDPRVGSGFLRPGIGWGGSCFPKDARALAAFSTASGYDFTLLRAVIAQNNDQLQRFLRLVEETAVRCSGAIGQLGLAFKAGTSDVRESTAVALAQALLEAGWQVKAFDPAVRGPQPRLPPSLTVVTSALAAAEDADALIIATEWPEFAALDFAVLRRVMRGDLLLDGRCIVDAARARAAGLRYAGVCAPAPAPGDAPM